MNFDRIGNEIVLYDSVTSDILLNNLYYYEYVEYQIMQLPNNNIAAILGFMSKEGSLDFRLKLFD